METGERERSGVLSQITDPVGIHLAVSRLPLKRQEASRGVLKEGSCSTLLRFPFSRYCVATHQG